jgi:predicted RNA-binding protein (virulence factor B family)
VNPFVIQPIIAIIFAAVIVTDMIQIGNYNLLKIDRLVEIGAYLDDGDKGILLPKRWVPEDAKRGDIINVFVYHDNEDRMIATTMQPFAVVGDIALLEAVTINSYGAFLKWGVMKDVFIAKSQQLSDMVVGGKYLVKLYIDERSNRVAATERIDSNFSNDVLTVKELDEVDLMVYRKSDLGYVMIMNNQHIGLLHNSEVFKKINIGDKLKGFVKKIYETNKIDVILGKPGYQRVEDEVDKVLRLLQENKGFLPFNDKSEPSAIYNFFGMSKKTFKMTTGNLFKQQKIIFTPKGIELVK